MKVRSFSIHAHFYQPPREDPLTGEIPIESGATPFPNWNERIHAECYRPNAELGNFGQISFNVGPTLCAWMSRHDPETCRKISRQDKMNVEHYGVGNAIAQAYNHTILPLMSYRDKTTQVKWGIREFTKRFGRAPQGMWLPETAVDLETLSVLAENGIEFTILAPWQADQDNLDTTEPYRVNLPHGREINVFFYDHGLSGGISFNPGMTVNADQFAAYDLLSRFQNEKLQRGEPQLVLLATDGELYGHHQPLRDHFLAHLVNGASTSLGMQPVFPGLWLRQYPVRRSVLIREATSWSCHHGVKRWMVNCDCSPIDGNWKAQLRYAFERLSSALDRLYLQSVASYCDEPWALRDDYIDVILGDRSIEDLVNQAAGRRLSEDKIVRTHVLLESQRERQRMFTSCGWFFDDFDRIEPQNNIAYAVQAVRLARMATGVDLEAPALSDLSRVSSPLTGLRGDAVFMRHMRRMVMDGRIFGAP